MSSSLENEADPPRAPSVPGAVSRRTILRMSAVAAAARAAGYGIGRASGGSAGIADWNYANIPDQRGRRVIITGANGYPHEGRSGLGYHQALGLARAGAQVTIASRNRERGEEAIRRMRAEVPAADVRFETLDLADLASIGAFAERVRASGDRLDLLINSAGVMGRLDRELSADGFERVFATNVLGPFAVTAHLLPLLRGGIAPRIVWMASSRASLGRLNLDDLQQDGVYDYGRAYDDSKLADLLLAFECDRRSRAGGWRISSVAAHPGVARTSLVLDGPGPDSAEGWRFRYIPMMWQDPAQGALPALYASTSSHAVGGGYYGPRDLFGLRGLPGVATPPAAASDLQAASRLWASLERLGGISFA